MSVTIYHNPACGTSRNTLAMIRDAGFAQTRIEPIAGGLVAIHSGWKF